MKKRFLKIVIGIVFVCVLFVGFLYANNDIGMTSTNLEADIRSSQKIKDDWTLEGSVSNTMAAYISYPQDMSDHTFPSMSIVQDFPSDIFSVEVELFRGFKEELWSLL